MVTGWRANWLIAMERRFESGTRGRTGTEESTPSGNTRSSVIRRGHLMAHDSRIDASAGPGGTRICIHRLSDGRIRRLPDFYQHSIFDLDWSPQGDRIVFSVTDGFGKTAISDMSVRNGRVRRLASPKGAQDLSPSYSPDGRLIAYGHCPGSIRVMNADGTRKRTLERLRGSCPINLAWSPDGSLLAFGYATRAWSVWLVDANGSQISRIFSGERYAGTCLAVGRHPVANGPVRPDALGPAGVRSIFEGGAVCRLIRRRRRHLPVRQRDRAEWRTSRISRGSLRVMAGSRGEFRGHTGVPYGPAPFALLGGPPPLPAYAFAHVARRRHTSLTALEHRASRWATASAHQHGASRCAGGGSRDSAVDGVVDGGLTHAPKVAANRIAKRVSEPGDRQSPGLAGSSVRVSYMPRRPHR